MVKPPSEPLRILLFGGFEVWCAGEQVRGFESQKVRALLAYLAVESGRAHSRDHLAALLWGEKDDETARRNLRQALYNLKSTLPGESSATPRLVADSQEVRFEPGAGCWLDVEAFGRAIGASADAGHIAFRDLLAAAQIYRGDLLAGFLLKDSPEFEEWLVSTQERLRETALEALRTLVAGCLSRGDYRLGIQHARRLVAMDPLSEKAHRQLLQLLHLAGHRSRALAHYNDLRELLRRELGVEPLAETRALYQSILSETLEAEAGAERAEPLGPIVPLVGRRDAHEALAECWQAVLDGGFQLTLLVGEEGVGKSRLARSFVDSATAHRPATVLTSAAYDQFPLASGQVLAEALRQGLLRDPEDERARLDALSRTTRDELARLLPELQDDGGAARALPPGSIARLAQAVVDLLRLLAGHGDEGAPGEPVVVLLDDLQWADAGTISLLAELVRALAGARVWILATVDPAALDHEPLRSLTTVDDGGAVRRVELSRLDGEALREVAASLVAPSDVARLAGLLAEVSDGLPLAMVTLLQSMWDEGDLVAEASGQWRFSGSAERWREAAAGGLDRALLHRVERLPASTRRLAAMAAVLGQRFETELLRRAEDEHPAVVEVGLELLLERWLVRQHRTQWSATGLESSLALWSRGARQGRFQFDHPRIRRAIYARLDPARRRELHGRAAAALAALHRERLESVAEDLAYHCFEAGDPAAARRHFEVAADKATRAGDSVGAGLCRSRAERLAAQTGDAEAAGPARSRQASRPGSPPQTAADV